MFRTVPGYGPGRRALASIAAFATAAALIVTACGGSGDSVPTQPGGATATPSLRDLRGDVTADGSSTVFPVSEAVAEKFGKVAPRVRVTVGVSGTGGGFKRFCASETDISNASRPISTTEKETCAKNGVEWTELHVGIDGLAVVVSKDNDFVTSLTTAELKKIWEPGSQINNWNQVRPSFPDARLALFGSDTESGTFDYFTEVINGQVDASRSDYTASSDDNVLVRGVAGSKFALGYFGFAYYVENTDKVKVLAIDPGDGEPVTPAPETINNGTYQPLSRPLYVYMNTKSFQGKVQVREFVKFYLSNAAELVKEVGYVELTTAQYAEQMQKLP